MGKASGWTPERKVKAAEAIRRNKPWAKATGPRTAEGKAIASRNADKGGHRPRQRAQMRLLREMSRASLEIIALVRAAHTGTIRDWGECIDPGYASSDAFLDARLRYDRASTEYWRITNDAGLCIAVDMDPYDLAAMAAFVLGETGLEEDAE